MAAICCSSLERTVPLKVQLHSLFIYLLILHLRCKKHFFGFGKCKYFTKQMKAEQKEII